jgi:thiamine kinase-like enzyme
VHEEISIPELTEVVARLSALLGPRQGGIVALEGGITNRNFRVNFGGDDYVVRLPGKDTDLLRIDREAERLATRQAAELGLGPRLAAMLEAPACLVTSFVPSRMVSMEELRAPEALTQIAQGLRRFHDADLSLPSRLSVVEAARDYAETARGRGHEPPAGYQNALAHAERVEGAVRGHRDHEPRACHNDLLAANFLRDNGRFPIVDWEYAGMGDRFFDLGNFAANNELTDEDEERLLEAYFGEPVSGRRAAALKLFRFMSDFREAMWGLVQVAVSRLEFDFSGYADRHFARVAARIEDPRFGAWREEAGGG